MCYHIRIVYRYALGEIYGVKKKTHSEPHKTYSRACVWLCSEAIQAASLLFIFCALRAIQYIFNGFPVLLRYRV